MAWSGVLFGVFGGEYPNRHFFSQGVMTQGGESMKQTKNAKALRDTFLVIRKGIRIHPSRKALLFQKMKTTITNNTPSKREVKVALPFLTSPSFVARIKRAATFEEMSLECFLKEGIESLLEHSEEHMIFNDAGEVVARVPWISSLQNSIPTPLKKPLPALAA